MTTSPTPRPEPEAAVRQETARERLRATLQKIRAEYDWNTWHSMWGALVMDAEAVLAAPQPQPVDERPMLRELREWIQQQTATLSPINDREWNRGVREMVETTICKIDQLRDATPPPPSPPAAPHATHFGVEEAMTKTDLLAAANALLADFVPSQRYEPHPQSLNWHLRNLQDAAAREEELRSPERRKSLAIDCAEDPGSASDVIWQQEQSIAALEAELAKARELATAVCDAMYELDKNHPTEDPQEWHKPVDAAMLALARWLTEKES